MNAQKQNKTRDQPSHDSTPFASVSLARLHDCVAHQDADAENEQHLRFHAFPTLMFRIVIGKSRDYLPRDPEWEISARKAV